MKIYTYILYFLLGINIEYLYKVNFSIYSFFITCLIVIILMIIHIDEYNKTKYKKIL